MASAILQRLIDAAFAAPEQTFVASLAAAVIIVVYDLGGGFSLNLPGRRRLGLAAMVALAGALVLQLATGGVSQIINSLAGDIVSAIVLGTILVMLFRN